MRSQLKITQKLHKDGIFYMFVLFLFCQNVILSEPKNVKMHSCIVVRISKDIFTGKWFFIQKYKIAESLLKTK